MIQYFFIQAYRQLRKEEILRRANQIVEGRSKRNKVKRELKDGDVQREPSTAPKETSNVQETEEVQISDSKMIEEAIINANLSKDDADIWREIIREEFSGIKNIPKHQEILQIFNGELCFPSNIALRLFNFNLLCLQLTLG